MKLVIEIDMGDGDIFGSRAKVRCGNILTSIAGGFLVGDSLAEVRATLLREGNAVTLDLQGVETDRIRDSLIGAGLYHYPGCPARKDTTYGPCTCEPTSHGWGSTVKP